MYAPSVAGEKQVVIGALVSLMGKPRVFVGRCSHNRTLFSPIASTPFNPMASCLGLTCLQSAELFAGQGQTYCHWRSRMSLLSWRVGDVSGLCAHMSCGTGMTYSHWEATEWALEPRGRKRKPAQCLSFPICTLEKNHLDGMCYFPGVLFVF